MRMLNAKKFIVMAMMVLGMLGPVPSFGNAAAETFAVTIEYDHLRQLLIDGNTSLKNNKYYANVADIENQLGVLKQECRDMVALSKIYSDGDGPEEAKVYKSNAASFSNTIKSLEKRLKSMTGTNASIETQIDMLEMQAQQAMISCLTLEENAKALEKQAEAAEMRYQNAVVRQSAGAATDAAVTSAHASMLNAQSQAIGMRQQADASRRSFLQMLGLQDDGSHVIMELPEPDIAAITSIPYESDKEAAVNVDSTVKSIRHGNSKSSFDMSIKSARETEAIGEAITDFDTAYTLLQTRLQEYQAAGLGFQSDEQEYQGNIRRKNAGMLTQADWLSAEANHISAQSAYKTARMNLVSAYANYKWLVKGIV